MSGYVHLSRLRRYKTGRYQLLQQVPLVSSHKIFASHGFGFQELPIRAFPWRNHAVLEDHASTDYDTQTARVAELAFSKVAGAADIHSAQPVLFGWRHGEAKDAIAMALENRSGWRGAHIVGLWRPRLDFWTITMTVGPIRSRTRRVRDGACVYRIHSTRGSTGNHLAPAMDS